MIHVLEGNFDGKELVDPETAVEIFKLRENLKSVLRGNTPSTVVPALLWVIDDLCKDAREHGEEIEDLILDQLREVLKDSAQEKGEA